MQSACFGRYVQVYRGKTVNAPETLFRKLAIEAARKARASPRVTSCRSTQLTSGDGGAVLSQLGKTEVPGQGGWEFCEKVSAQ